MPFLLDNCDYQNIAKHLELSPYSLQSVGSSGIYRSYQIGGIGWGANTVDLKYFGQCLEELDAQIGFSEDPEKSYINRVKTLLTEIDNLEEQIRQLQVDECSQYKAAEIFEQYKWQRPDNKNGWDGVKSLKEDFIRELKTLLRIPTSSYNGLLIRSY